VRLKLEGKLKAWVFANLCGFLGLKVVPGCGCDSNYCSTLRSNAF
jgi:hypothetical protein